MVSAWRNFKNIFPIPLFIIIFRPEMLKIQPYSILTGDTRVEFVIYSVLSNIFIFFQIGWLKADTKAIQAIGKHVISNNDRISVSHDETRAKFRLHITNVTLEDAGPYMCQINSMPVKLQVSAKCFSIYYFL